VEKQSVAIIGLGRVGSRFLEILLSSSSKGIAIAAVVENGNTPGRAAAQAHGIKVISIDELVAKGDAVDIIFDLTGVATVRKELREKLFAVANRHTVIATESIARLIWALITDGSDLPEVHHKTGY